MKTHFRDHRWIPILILLWFFCSRVSTAAAQDRDTQVAPNIVLFLVDDMGWQDTSVNFGTEVTPLNRRYRTPNMERLAASGLKFTQAYACSVCSPTRVSLMTGLNAARHRVTNWTLKKNATNDRPHPTLKFPKWNMNGLCPNPGVEGTVHAKALPAFLKEAGYHTIHVGKAHFGATGTAGADPRGIGFDVNIGGHAAGGPGSYLESRTSVLRGAMATEYGMSLGLRNTKAKTFSDRSSYDRIHCRHGPSH